MEARKLRIIEAFNGLKDMKKIHQIESLLLPTTPLEECEAMLAKLSGAWHKEEVDEMKKIIEEGCERIDENEW